MKNNFIFIAFILLFTVNLTLSSEAKYSKKDLTSLLKSARSGNSSEIKKFFKKGLTAKSKNSAGKTALMSAASSGNIETFVILLANGADIYQKDKKGRNALNYAKEYNHEDKIKSVIFGLNLINKNQNA